MSGRPPMACDDARDLAAGFVLGALEPDEEHAVRDHLATCPNPHPEFEELGSTATMLLEDIELVEPPASLRDRVMAAAAADLAARQGSPAPAPSEVAPATTPFPSAAERSARAEARGRRSPLAWVAGIAAVLAIVALGAWNLSLQSQLNATQAYEQAVAGVITAASHPGAQTVILTPEPDGSGSGIGAVSEDGSLVLAMRDLPATNGSEVYETWVIVEGVDPLAVGGFTVDRNGVASFTTRPANTPAGAVIALTLEPNAGNTAPMGPVVSKGVTTPPVGIAGMTAAR